MLERLKRSFENAPVIPKGDYNYVVHPITDGAPMIDPILLEEVLEAMEEELPEFDIIVTAEAMGIPLATGLSLRHGKPFTIIRKRKYGLPGEVEVHQKTGYSKGRLYINGLKKGDRILLVDDMLSTGGTLWAILAAFRSMGVKVMEVVIVVEKGNGSVRRGLERQFGVEIRALMNI
jgi:adenine phosphoribosyltransferase